MEFYGDYHTHTYYSDGNQGIIDIIQAAEKRGLKEVAITDHGPAATFLGVRNKRNYYSIRKSIIRYQEKSKVKILWGAEANICNRKGRLDISQDLLDQMDIVLAGLHPFTWPYSFKEQWQYLWTKMNAKSKNSKIDDLIKLNTEKVVEALQKNSQIDILSHPNGFFTVDIDVVAKTCADQQVLFEINCGHEIPEISDIIKAKEAGVKFIINSDAHSKENIGNFAYGEQAIKQLKLDTSIIVNSSKNGGYSEWGKRSKAYRS